MFEAKKVIGISNNGINVYDATSIGGHIHQGVMPIINEVISKVNLEGTFVRETVNMGKVIGKDHLVETVDDDIIVYMKRGNREGKSRMVLKNADDTTFVTIILCVANEGDFHDDWVVVTSFEGKPGEREPWDDSLKTEEQKEAAEAFWSTHALVPTEEELEQIKKEKKEAIEYAFSGLATPYLNTWNDEVYYKGIIKDAKKVLDAIKKMEEK